MPSLFRRKSTDLVADAVADAEESAEAASTQRKGYTPSKRELGKATPKRPDPRGRRAPEAPPANRKEALKQARARNRAMREEQRIGMLEGDERYLLRRDKGPERSLVRDIVDSRRTLGTWFFGAAFVVLLIGMNRALPVAVQAGANMFWLLLALATALDCFLISRRVNILVRARFPKTKERMGSLYMYAALRSVMFRRMRTPKAKVAIGAEV